MSNNFLVVAYDGKCLLCSKFISFIFKNKRNDCIRFIDLHHEHFQEVIIREFQETLEEDSIVCLTKGMVFLRSEGIAKIAVHMTQPYRGLLGLFNLLPKFLKEGMYKLVARNRKKLWPEINSCAWTPGLEKIILY